MTNAYVVSEQDQWQEDTRLFHAHVVGVLVNVYSFRIVKPKITIPNIPAAVHVHYVCIHVCNLHEHVRPRMAIDI